MVTLRDFIESDAEQLVAILNDSDVTQYLSTKVPSPYNNADALWWINEGSRGSLIKAIVYNNKLIGCIGLNRGEFEYNRSGEIGYWLAKDYWRQGINTPVSIDAFPHCDLVIHALQSNQFIQLR